MTRFITALIVEDNWKDLPSSEMKDFLKTA